MSNASQGQTSTSSSKGVKELATAKLETTRASAHDAASRASESIESNPLGVLAGGLALGIVAGALVPRSERERELLTGVGKRLADGATAAAAAAKQSGKEQLSAALFSPDGAREGIAKVMENTVKAAKEGASAA